MKIWVALAFEAATTGKNVMFKVPLLSLGRRQKFHQKF
jgi:hypothetical protein